MRLAVSNLRKMKTMTGLPRPLGIKDEKLVVNLGRDEEQLSLLGLQDIRTLRLVAAMFHSLSQPLSQGLKPIQLSDQEGIRASVEDQYQTVRPLPQLFVVSQLFMMWLRLPPSSFIGSVS